MPFREEGELSRKDEKLYGQPLGRWRELHRSARTKSVETNVVGWQLGHYPEDTEEPGTLKGFPAGQSQIRLVMQDSPCSQPGVWKGWWPRVCGERVNGRIQAGL